MVKQFYLIQGESGPKSNGNNGVLYIPQSCRTGASPSGAAQYYVQDSCSGCVTPSAEMPLVYSTDAANWAKLYLV